MIQEKLKNAFVRALGIEVKLVTDSLAYQSIPQWDSITHMILISEIETEFEISIKTDDVIDLSSFAKALEIVNKYL